MRFYVNREKKVVIADNSQCENNLATELGYEEISSVQYNYFKEQYEAEFDKNNTRGNCLWQKINS
jgi:hypothetical protein